MKLKYDGLRTSQRALIVANYDPDNPGVSLYILYLPLPTYALTRVSWLVTPILVSEKFLQINLKL